VIDFLFGLAVGVFVAIGITGVAVGFVTMWIRKAIGRMM